RPSTASAQKWRNITGIATRPAQRASSAGRRATRTTPSPTRSKICAPAVSSGPPHAELLGLRSRPLEHLAVDLDAVSGEDERGAADEAASLDFDGRLDALAPKLGEHALAAVRSTVADETDQ